MKNTVLITGASSGLGEEFAWQLAALGYDVLLVARRVDKLLSLRKKIATKYPLQRCLILPVDLIEEDAADILLNFIALKKIHIVGLINNAGFGARGQFSEVSALRQRQMLQVNINVLTMLTHSFIPLLKQQPQSFIINVASTAAFQAGPNLALYYASKAFVLSFSEALHEELKGKVQVSALCPGATKTEFAEVAGMPESTLFKARVMDKHSVVKYALNKRRRAIVVPGVINKIGVIVVKLLPRWLTRKLAYLIQK